MFGIGDVAQVVRSMGLSCRKLRVRKPVILVPPHVSHSGIVGGAAVQSGKRATEVGVR